MYFRIVVFALLASTVAAEEPAPSDPRASLRAENKLLRATIDRQTEELNRLRRRVDLMLHRMEKLGITAEQLEAADPPLPKPAPAVETESAQVPAANAPARTVFLIDASGSMINSLPLAKAEVLKAVRAMQPGQHFGVIVTQDERSDMFQPTLVPATPANVRRFAAFLDKVSTTGTTNMLPGVEKALRLHPSVLWVVTDGDFPDNNAMLTGVRRMNRGGCRINTMFMGQADETPASVIEVLRDLATQNGGACYDSTGKRLSAGRVAPAAGPVAPPRPKEPKYGTMREEDLPSGPSIFDEHSAERGPDARTGR